MKLYYTGAKTFNAIQDKPYLSLGGFMSSSPVPNDKLDNLFESPSQSILSEGRNSCIGIILKNELANLVNLRFFFELNEKDIFNYKIGFSEVAIQGTTRSIEKIYSTYSKPYLVEFNQAPTVDQQLELEAFNLNDHLGIWILREFSPEKYKEQYSSSSLENLLKENVFEELNQLNQLTKIKLIIEFDKAPLE